MKKLSELRDNEVMEFYAWIADCGERFFKDEKLKNAFSKEGTISDKFAVVRILINDYKSEVLRLLAIFNGVTVDELHYGVFDLPLVLISILSDQGIQDFFGSLQALHGAMESLTAFGFATENTKDVHAIS